MLRAIIFDFDGVIVDSEIHHLRTFQQVLREEDVELTDEAYFTKYLGLDDKNAFRTVLTDHARTVDTAAIQALVDRKAIYYDRLKDDVLILPGASEFIKKAATHYPLAIGSGALRHEIEYALERMSARSAVRVIVSAEDIEHSKPAPDCYLTVLDQLNNGRPDGSAPLKSSECVVVEDAPRGITAAKAAGMWCVGVTSSYKADELQDADLVVSGLDALTVDQLEKLVS